MFVDEARLASRVQHPNVVPVLDVVSEGGEIFIVMEYVRGPALSTLLGAALRQSRPVPAPIAVRILVDVLAGLQAAHEARDRRGEPLGIVHRDVSPQNVLVGIDGVARIMDFGIATAATRLAVTQQGELKGKLSYMAPEQFHRSEPIDRRVDVFAAGVVLWSTLAGRRLFSGEDISDTMVQVLTAEVPLLAKLRADVPEAIDAALSPALARDRNDRYASARDFAMALEAACAPASGHVVAEWVRDLAQDMLAQRDALISLVEDTGSMVFESPMNAPAAHDAPPEEGGSAAAARLQEDTTTTTRLAPEAATAVAPATSRPPWIALAAGVAAVALVGTVALVLLGREPPPSLGSGDPAAPAGAIAGSAGAGVEPPPAAAPVAPSSSAPSVAVIASSSASASGSAPRRAAARAPARTAAPAQTATARGVDVGVVPKSGP
jgi:serine/threonine-protein kinase